MRVLRRSLTAVLVAALCVTSPRAAAAAGDDLPVRKQALLLLRVLVYDRNLKARAHGAVRIAVAYRPHDAASEGHRDALLDGFESLGREVVAAGLPVEAVAVPFHDAEDFAARLGRAGAVCLYVGPGLAAQAREVERAARAHALLTATGDRALLDAGLAIGLVNRGPRAGVVVNLPAARGEGADLDAALLAIAEVLP
jgi:hypothetical protein